jgi:hypothetical protein
LLLVARASLGVGVITVVRRWKFAWIRARVRQLTVAYRVAVETGAVPGRMPFVVKLEMFELVVHPVWNRKHSFFFRALKLLNNIRERMFKRWSSWLVRILHLLFHSVVIVWVELKALKWPR